MKFLENSVVKVVLTALRVWLGYEWLTAGWEKISGPGSAVWVGSKAGVAIKGFLGAAVKNSIATPQNQHPSVEAWYGSVVQHVFMPLATPFSYAVSYGEVLVGLGLIFGALTTIALYAAALMNLNYMLAGSAGVNPRMYTFAIILLVCGASAYSYGLDRWIIPYYKKLVRGDKDGRKDDTGPEKA